MSNDIPHIITPTTITVFLDGSPRSVPADSHSVAELRSILASDDPDLDRLRALVDPAVGIAKALDGSAVEVDGSCVYFRGKRVNEYLERTLLDVVAAGFDPGPFKRFVSRLYSNPSPRAIEELYKFLERGDLPLTNDGCFLAYKRVNENYTDCHTGKIDNSVGQVVEMPRREVDDDARRTCSTGLHFCSQGYLKHFVPGRGRIVILKIDPADVVSIPVDYDHTKGRCWRYTVVDEVDLTAEDAKPAWGIVELSYDSEWDDDDFDGDLFDEWEDDDDAPAASPFAIDADSDTDTITSVRSDYGVQPPARVSWWRKFTRRG